MQFWIKMRDCLFDLKQKSEKSDEPIPDTVAEYKWADGDRMYSKACYYYRGIPTTAEHPVAINNFCILYLQICM